MNKMPPVGTVVLVVKTNYDSFPIGSLGIVTLNCYGTAEIDFGEGSYEDFSDPTWPFYPKELEELK